ncbi:hypothetical protein NHH03_03870 [Stieleria sp. TO1_6]|uniref:hypothetical protein n=1 Tax=Stieleria tagensis TaxID=2956795 RepID=UPI00209B2B62|nr:hypothetical protein [Stieleria tagensis]MCO8120862.1 hypothetical protein [Stieleria tagensis]
MKSHSKTILSLALSTLLAVAVLPHTLQATEVTIRTPDGAPAAGAKVYQTFVEPVSQGDMYGGGEYGDMMMMGSYGMMDSMGGMDDMGMGMEMGMDGGMSSQPTPRPTEIAFLDGKPLVKPDGQFYSHYDCDDAGKLDLPPDTQRQQRRPSTRTQASMLVVSDSAISFLPAGTTLKPEIELRSMGKLLVEPQPEVQAERFEVLTCWQNGFAWPSLEQFSYENPKGQVRVDEFDWRFKARFRWFQKSLIGDVVNVPPGEVRVTILPRGSIEKAIQESATTTPAEALFEKLIAGGPSQIVVVGGSSGLTRVPFAPLRSLSCKLSDDQTDHLPQWGDQPEASYRLQPLSQQGIGALQAEELPTPPLSDLKSTATFSRYLNNQRAMRSSFQPARMPSKSSDASLHFELIAPGNYAVKKFTATTDDAVWMPIINWQQMKGGTVCVLGEGSSQLNPAVMKLSLNQQGQITTFQSLFPSVAENTNLNDPFATPATVPAAAPAVDQQVDVVRKLRLDVETTIKRLTEHRLRLLRIEQALQPNRPAADPFGGSTDPFGPDPFAPNPFGDQNSESDPFGP